MSHTSGSTRKTPVPWPLYGLFGVAVLLIVAAMGYLFQQIRDINETHDPLLLLLADAELSATQAHLWFEEVLSGDRQETIEQVVGLLDEVEATLHVLSGKPSPSVSHPRADPLSRLRGRPETPDSAPPGKLDRFHLSHALHTSSAIKDALSNVDTRFDTLREFLAERYRTSRTSGPGTEIDQRCDRVFGQFLEATADTKRRVMESKKQHVDDFRTLQASIIGLSLALAGAVLLIFVRFERRRAATLTTLANSEQALAWERSVDHALAELARTLIDPGLSIQAVADQVLARAQGVTDSGHGFVSEIDRDTGENIGHTLTAMMGKACKVAGPNHRVVFPRKDDGRFGKLWGHALDTGEPFFTNAPGAHPRAKGLPKGHVPLERFLSVPVIFGGEVVGQIALANPPGDYTERHLGAVQRLADLYALAIHRHRNAADHLRLEDQIHQAQKMEAIGTLAGGIAHDFNNILGAILGYSELALLRLPKDSKVAEDLTQVVAAGMRARELVKQILAFSRRGDPTREPIQTHLVVSEALRLLRQTIPTSIPIVSSISKKDDTVLIDPTQLHQIVMNLCTNAYHAMRAGGGTLSVTLQPVDVSSSLAATVSGLKEGPHVKLTVADTGAGMTPETLARAFEPFFTTKGVGEGTGMGLPVVHGIVSSMEGAIAIESRPGEGTRIDVYLPRHSREAAPATREERGAPGGTGRILVVDDEPALATMTRKMLTSLGYEVESVTTSQKALALFLEDPARFDLVVTDQTMPGMTGADLTKKMLARRPDLPIVICTGYSESLDEASAREIGVRAFLDKPLERTVLAQTLRAVLAP